jgi:putative phage-type endonuclease
MPKFSNTKLEYFRNQVIKLHNTFQPVQKSKEWYEMRNGLLTASDWGKILDAKTDVLLKKCGDDKFIGGAAIDWGNKYEQVANMIYEYRNNVEVLEFGCLKHPNYDCLGASPDGITRNGIMVEIKCPYSRKITGIPKYEYWCQVQGQLEVCDLERCDFIECCIKEYSDEIEYLNDTTNNTEKGVIADFYVKSEKKYIKFYSKLFLKDIELEEWKNTIINTNSTEDIMFFNFSYWRLEEVSCIPIYRNQEWFSFARPILENYWNYIIKYRTLGIDNLRKDLTNGSITLEKIVNKSLYDLDSHDKTYEKIYKKESRQDNKKQKKINDYKDIINLNDTNTIINLNDTNTNIYSLSDTEEEEFTIDMNQSLFSD